MSIVITAGQRGDSPQFEPVLNKIRVARTGSGRPRTRPNRVRADRAYASRKNRATCANAAFAAPSRTRPTRSATARSSAFAAAARPSSMPRTTRLGTRSSAALIASKGTAPWLPVTTSSRSAMRQPSLSRPSTSGCDHTLTPAFH
jgi:hypothetical protein